MTLDAVILYLQRGFEATIPELIEKAIQSANHELYWSTRKDSSIYASLAIAVVLNKQTLYIANVGDNQIYLVREGRLTHLTLDTPLSITEGDGLISEETSYPSSSNHISVIGLQPEVPVDIGFHVNESHDEKEFLRAQIRGMKGLPLKNDDSLVISTSRLKGLRSATATAMITNEELISAVMEHKGQPAVDALISASVNRGAGDNLTFAVLQNDQPKSSGITVPLAVPDALIDSLKEDPAKFYNILAVVVMVLVVFVAFLFLRGGPDATAENDDPETIVAQTDTTESSASEIETNATSPTSPPSEINEGEQTAKLPANTSTPRPTATSAPTKQVAIATSEPVTVTEGTESTIENTESVAATVQPTATTAVTPTLVAAVESEPTATTASPTNTPAGPIYFKPALQNLSCAAAWNNYAADSKIELNWTWAGRLRGTEYLEIRVGPRGANLTSIGKVFAEPNGNFWRWFITPQGYFLSGGVTEYQWEVVHMTGNGRTVLARSGRGCFTVK